MKQFEQMLAELEEQIDNDARIREQRLLNRQCVSVQTEDYKENEKSGSKVIGFENSN